MGSCSRTLTPSAAGRFSEVSLRDLFPRALFGVKSFGSLWSARDAVSLSRGPAEPTEPMLHRNRRYKSMTSAKRRETWSRGVLACLRSSHAQCENRQRTRRRELAVVGQHLGATTGCAPARSHQQACGQASATTSFAGFFSRVQPASFRSNSPQGSGDRLLAAYATCRASAQSRDRRSRAKGPSGTLHCPPVVQPTRA